MSDVWRVTLRLGSWSCPVELSKDQFETAQDAINFAAQAVIDARDVHTEMVE